MLIILLLQILLKVVIVLMMEVFQKQQVKVEIIKVKVLIQIVKLVT